MIGLQLRTAAERMGNGDVKKGAELLAALGSAMRKARRKPPVFAEGKYHALGVIGAEFHELEQAVESESPERQTAEAMDVAVTALRFVLGEHHGA